MCHRQQQLRKSIIFSIWYDVCGFQLFSRPKEPGPHRQKIWSYRKPTSCARHTPSKPCMKSCFSWIRRGHSHGVHYREIRALHNAIMLHKSKASQETHLWSASILKRFDNSSRQQYTSSFEHGRTTGLYICAHVARPSLPGFRECPVSQ